MTKDWTLSRISKKGQICLPLYIREALSISGGDYIGMKLEDGKITIAKIKVIADD